MDEVLTVIQKNIERLSRRGDSDTECMRAHIAELAGHICGAMPPADGDPVFWNETLFRIYSGESEFCLKAELPIQTPAHPETRERKTDIARRRQGRHSVPESQEQQDSTECGMSEERIMLCEMIAQRFFESGRLRSRPTLWRIAGADTDNTDSDMIAYVRNIYSDAAYDIFGEYLSAPTMTYCENFESACEAVYDGNAGYCILPTENTNDGRLAGFSRLISKYELKTRIACEIPSADGSSYTRLSLMSRGIREPEPGNGAMFSFTFTPSPRYPLGNVLSAAAHSGMQLYRIDSMPLSYSQSEYAYHITFKAPDRGISNGFLFFLALEAPGSVITGYYPVIRL